MIRQAQRREACRLAAARGGTPVPLVGGRVDDQVSSGPGRQGQDEAADPVQGAGELLLAVLVRLAVEGEGEFQGDGVRRQAGDDHALVLEPVAIGHVDLVAVTVALADLRHAVDLGDPAALAQARRVGSSGSMRIPGRA